VKSVIVGIEAVRLNSALTERIALIATTHVVPEQSPPHPEKLDPGAGAAVSVTDTVLAKVASQVTPQLIPIGLEVTVPEPSPVFMTFKSAAPAGSATKTTVIRKTATPGVIR